MPTTQPIGVPHRRQRYRFFVFTCRDPRSDFRLPLVDALQEHYETYYIWLRRRPMIAGPDSHADFVQMSLIGLLKWIWSFKTDAKVNIYFNSTNTSFPGLTALLRLVAKPGVWCMDMHDDLRYHYKGIKRLRTRLAIRTQQLAADVVVHAAPTLKELFPRALRLGNASHLQAVTYTGTDPNAILILASFDERFDFDFVDRLVTLCPSLNFHLHGWTRRDDPGTLHRIQAMQDAHPNLRYHGPYSTDDLPTIFAAYRISVAPYLTNSLMTRYIEPLRFYHCLNAGLEIISTDIPQARFMQDAIHVVPNAEACASLLKQMQTGAFAKQPAYSPITWDLRVDRLIEILSELPRTKTLEASRPVDANISIAKLEPERE